MANANTGSSKVSNLRRQGRRVIPALRRKGATAKAVASKQVLTLGDLIAAAFDTVGTSAKDVAQVISSRQMSQKIGRKIVFV